MSVRPRRAEVRAYWTEQWSEIDPHVEPVSFHPEGVIAVTDALFEDDPRIAEPAVLTGEVISFAFKAQCKVCRQGALGPGAGLNRAAKVAREVPGTEGKELPRLRPPTLFARLAATAGERAMNTEWHKRHVLTKGAPLRQRIAWHREHQKRCGCRPVPPNLKKEMAGPPSKKPEPEPAIDEYLATVGVRNRALLQQLRKTIHATVPEVEECISYRLPAFRFRGRIIAGLSATSRGCSYYPFSGTTLKTLASEIKGYSQTKSALHFGPEKPLPASLVRKLLKERIAEGTRRRSDRPPA